MKQRFIDLLRSVDRPGIDSLVGYIENETDFFTAPASSQYHGAKEGGLVEHSLAVYEHLVRLTDQFLAGYKPETLIISALLHDLCKANFYKVDYRNKKNEHGIWEKVPYYAIEDQLPLGHGEKSVMIIQRFIRPTVAEVMAIRWHMGSFGASDYATTQSLSNAFNMYPLTVALHMADLAACYFDKK